jgi:putative peptide zinc metalloprotease protein
MKRRILVLAATAVAAVGFSLAAPRLAHAQGGDNTAVAVNTKDGSSIFKVAFAIRHVMSDVVDQSNAAVAVSSCNECQSVAVAIEIVLIESNASTIQPTNMALAINVDCTLCVTVADAYQFVYSTGGAVHFDAEGNKTLADIRKELEKLKHENLTLAELQATLDDIKARILDVLAHHLVATGKPEERSNAPPRAATTTSPESPPTTAGTTTTPTESTTTEPATSTEPTTTSSTTTTGATSTGTP